MFINEALHAISNIRRRAVEHPAFDRELFDSRDFKALGELGGDTLDWTMTAIEADLAIKILKQC
jgi:hypothetical protein